jgi:hypothetical protein
MERRATPHVQARDEIGKLIEMREAILPQFAKFYTISSEFAQKSIIPFDSRIPVIHGSTEMFFFVSSDSIFVRACVPREILKRRTEKKKAYLLGGNLYSNYVPLRLRFHV